jgi:hypothetical protein
METIVKYGYVYLWKSELGYKIGKTGRTVEDRLNEFKTLPFEVIEVYSRYVPNYSIIESKLHKIFKNYKINGEWFDLTLEDVIYIINYLNSIK